MTHMWLANRIAHRFLGGRWKALALAIGLCGCASPTAPLRDRTPPAAGTPGTAVHVWLSRAETAVRLQRQADITPAPIAALADDIVIDTGTRHQSMVGFGAAMTDASASLIQRALPRAPRDALLRELFGPPPGLA